MGFPLTVKNTNPETLQISLCSLKLRLSILQESFLRYWTPPDFSSIYKLLWKWQLGILIGFLEFKTSGFPGDRGLRKVRPLSNTKAWHNNEIQATSRIHKWNWYLPSMCGKAYLSSLFLLLVITEFHNLKRSSLKYLRVGMIYYKL